MPCRSPDYRRADADHEFETERAYCTAAEAFVQPTQADVRSGACDGPARPRPFVMFKYCPRVPSNACCRGARPRVRKGDDTERKCCGSQAWPKAQGC